MESREQQYGWAADDPRWTDGPAGTSPRDADAPPPDRAGTASPPDRAGTASPPDRAGTASTSGSERADRRDHRVRRRRRSDEDEFRRTTRAEIFGEEPPYPALFGLTAAWYAVPVVLFVAWFVAGGEGTGRQILASVPWLLTALALSLAVAALLRWAAVGWRAMTLSFAAAVIGAGVATIAHSLAI